MRYKSWLFIAVIVIIALLIFTYPKSEQYLSSVPIIQSTYQFDFWGMKKLTTYEEIELKNLCKTDKPYTTELIKECEKEVLVGYGYEIIEKELLKNKVNICNNSISENSEIVLRFMQDNRIIGKEDVSENDISSFYCINCLAFSTAYRNVTTNNTLIFYAYHNRFRSDASFDERVVCEIKPNYNVLKLYISAGVGHAS